MPTIGHTCVKRGECSRREAGGGLGRTSLSCTDCPARFLRQLALPASVKHWTLTTLRNELIKIGCKVVHHARRVVFQLAEAVIPRLLFALILRRIERLRLLLQVAPAPPAPP